MASCIVCWYDGGPEGSPMWVGNQFEHAPCKVLVVSTSQVWGMPEGPSASLLKTMLPCLARGWEGIEPTVLIDPWEW